MIEFVNKVELNGQKYQTNGTVREETCEVSYNLPCDSFCNME